MNRHELDPVSLIFGFVFTGLGLLFLIGRADQALRLQWVWPLLLLALGAGILLDLTRSQNRQALNLDPEVGPGPGVEGEPGFGVGGEPGFGVGVGSGAEVGSGTEVGPGAEGPVDNREQLT